MNLNAPTWSDVERELDKMSHTDLMVCKKELQMNIRKYKSYVSKGDFLLDLISKKINHKRK